MTMKERQLKEFQTAKSLEEKLMSGAIAPEANGGRGTLSDLSLEELVILQTQVAKEIQSRLGM